MYLLKKCEVSLRAVDFKLNLTSQMLPVTVKAVNMDGGNTSSRLTCRC
jgi:hypothetical protein